MTNIVYIATSLDGYIADKEGGLAYLDQIETPDGSDFGYGELMERIDALVMGSTTYETVLGFDVEWPYPKPVFVLSRRLTEAPAALEGKVEFMSGEIADVLEKLQARGYANLYIDGGAVIQSFLRADLIDELIISIIPVLLGGGTPLFGDLETPLWFDPVETSAYAGGLVKNRYLRRRG